MTGGAVPRVVPAGRSHAGPARRRRPCDRHRGACGAAAVNRLRQAGGGRVRPGAERASCVRSGARGRRIRAAGGRGGLGVRQRCGHAAVRQRLGSSARRYRVVSSGSSPGARSTRPSTSGSSPSRSTGSCSSCNKTCWYTTIHPLRVGAMVGSGRDRRVGAVG